jgi:penicillin-binding protein 1A
MRAKLEDLRAKVEPFLKRLESGLSVLLAFLRNYKLLPKADDRLGRKFILSLWGTFAFSFLFVFAFVQLVIWNFFGLFGEIPSMSELERPKILAASELYTADKTLIGRYFLENRSPVRYNKISPNVIHALLATEDIRFHEHSGIDPQAFFGIIFSFLGGERRGGSTITQQLAKNLFKTRKKHAATGKFELSAPVIKLKEWVLALRLESTFTKEEIITLYLNTVDFGANSFGIKTAAKTFFSTSPDSLSIPQAATLVGLLKATTTYSPIKNPEASLKRRNVVIAQMAKYNFISKELAEGLYKKDLGLKLNFEQAENGATAYFANAINNFLREWCAENGYDLYTDGLKIYTTIDSRIQKHAEDAVAEQMAILQKRFFEHWRGMNPWVDRQFREIPNYIEDAVKRTDRYKDMVKVLGKGNDKIEEEFMKPIPMKVFSWYGVRDTVLSPIDSIRYYKHFLHPGLMAMNPYDGTIKAWVGGINFEFFKYDHVMQAKRQPGSTFKPFIYTAAIDSFGYSPCDRLPDRVNTFTYEEKGKTKFWTPRNADWLSIGDSITLRHAIGKSVNTVAAQLTMKIGWQAVADYARRMGITSPLEVVPSIGLGSNEVSIYEMVGAYGAFLNRGVWTKPMFISHIEDRNGRVIYRFKPERRKAMSEETAWLMTYMLQGSIQEPYGTSGRLYSFGVLNGGNEIAGKTGTSSSHADGWYMGLIKDLVTGVRVGGDDRSIHFRSGEQGEGSKTALPIYGAFLRRLFDDPASGITRSPLPKPTVPIQKPYFCPTPKYVIDTARIRGLVPAEVIRESEEDDIPDS